MTRLIICLAIFIGGFSISIAANGTPIYIVTSIASVIAWAVIPPARRSAQS